MTAATVGGCSARTVPGLMSMACPPDLARVTGPHTAASPRGLPSKRSGKCTVVPGMFNNANKGQPGATTARATTLNRRRSFTRASPGQPRGKLPTRDKCTVCAPARRHLGMETPIHPQAPRFYQPRPVETLHGVRVVQRAGSAWRAEQTGITGIRGWIVPVQKQAPSP